MIVLLCVQTCNKQYKNAFEMEAHISSYDHHHKKVGFATHTSDHAWLLSCLAFTIASQVKPLSSGLYMLLAQNNNMIIKQMRVCMCSAVYSLIVEQYAVYARQLSVAKH